MTGWYILIAVLLLVLFLLFSNVKAAVKYDNELTLRISYLFLRFDIPPEKKKEKRKKEKPEKQTKEKKGDSFFKKHGVSGFIDILKDVLSFVNKHMRNLSHIVVSDFSADVVIGGDNASDIALNYAKTCAVIYPAVAEIFKILKYKDYTVAVTPNFNLDKSRASANANLRIRLVFLLSLLFGLGADGIKLYLNIRKGKYNIKEGGAENDRTSD